MSVNFQEVSSRLRKHLGLNQAEMASRLGITRSYYGELEVGKRPASATLQEMIHLLDRLEGAHADSVGSAVSDNKALYFASKRIASEEDQSSNVRINPEFEDRKRSIPEPTTEEKIIAHLRRWLAAAETNPEVAGYLYTQLRLHLPLEQIDLLMQTLNDKTP